MTFILSLSKSLPFRAPNRPRMADDGLLTSKRWLPNQCRIDMFGAWMCGGRVYRWLFLSPSDNHQLSHGLSKLMWWNLQILAANPHRRCPAETRKNGTHTCQGFDRLSYMCVCARACACACLVIKFIDGKPCPMRRRVRPWPFDSNHSSLVMPYQVQVRRIVQSLCSRGCLQQRPV